VSTLIERLSDIEWTTVVPPGGVSSLEEVEAMRQQSQAVEAQTGRSAVR
jgi:hypothetical protein